MTATAWRPAIALPERLHERAGRARWSNEPSRRRHRRRIRGLRTLQALRGAGVEITLIDRRNFLLVQPLAYQVATGALSPDEIAYPLRALFKDRADVRVLQANVGGIDADTCTVRIENVDDIEPAQIGYDTLIVAAESAYSYFGHEEGARPRPR